MRTVAIVQARMTSARLPGKVLTDLGGQPVLARVLNRVARARMIGDIVVATTTQTSDDVLAETCAERGWHSFRGNEIDVLDRYYHAAKAYKADNIVRVTADCPLVEPEVIDLVVGTLLETNYDYASNVLKRTYPRGLDVEAMTCTCLSRAWHETSEPWHRAHVTPYVYLNPGKFRLASVTGDADFSAHRWTVDTPQDLEFVKAVYNRLGNDDAFSWRDVLRIVAEEPWLANINRNVTQKSPQEC